MTRVFERPLSTWLGVLGTVFAVQWTAASAQQTTRVSVDSASVEANNFSENASISFDGRLVMFTSFASNLVPGDTNNGSDVFLHDRATAVTTKLSVDSAGVPGNGSSSGGEISSDGRFATFLSSSNNLVPGDTNGTSDVFVKDLTTQETTRVSVDSAGVEANGYSLHASISADGRFVAFSSGATNLVPGDTTGGFSTDIFVHDRDTGQTTRVSVSSAGVEANGSCFSPSISADGRFVAFTCSASNLVPGDTNGVEDVFVHDRTTATTARVSVDALGAQANRDSNGSTISADGRFVAFVSHATNLLPGAAHGIYVHDRQTGAIEQASVSSAGVMGQSHFSSAPSLSADGRFVAFYFEDPDLVPSDTNGLPDAYVRDRATETTTRVSVDTTGAHGSAVTPPFENGFHVPRVSGNGLAVAFLSWDPSLVVGDTNNENDVFVRELRDPALCRAGTVNLGMGSAVDVLRVNGSAGDANRIVTTSASVEFSISLDASPSGPGEPGLPTARYVYWVWRSVPSNAIDLVARGEVLGCTVNPTPLRPLASPQPFRCRRGTGISDRACRGVPSPPGPSRAPWDVTRLQGVDRAGRFTLQGLIEDAGSSNGQGFSVTNAVLLVVN